MRRPVGLTLLKRGSSQRGKPTIRRLEISPIPQHRATNSSCVARSFADHLACVWRLIASLRSMIAHVLNRARS
jgi:hypothetical protein